MSKQRMLVILGVLVAIMPFSGFPSSWRTIFFLIFGVSIIVLAYQIDKIIKHLKKENELTSFVDNRDIHENKN